jgi:hypothetical protein
LISLGKNHDPRLAQVLRAYRGVAHGPVQDALAAAELAYWLEVFRIAGREALSHRSFEDTPYQVQDPAVSPTRIRGWWAWLPFFPCVGIGLWMGHHAKGWDTLALPILGVIAGLAAAALILALKLFMAASRPARHHLRDRAREAQCAAVGPEQRIQAVERLLAGAGGEELAERFGASPASIEAWGVVYLDAGQGALKQRFGPAKTLALAQG